MSIKYNVHVGEYAESHYIKDFSKKYKKEREYTFFTIVKMLEHLDNFLWDTKIEIIHQTSDTRFQILKGEFSVAKSNISPHASWNRYILLVDRENKTCTILLLYHKSHIEKKMQETKWWQLRIKNEYKEIKALFPNL